MFNKKTLRDINLEDKKVLVRVDFNVPIRNNKVENNLRIKSVLPTIRYLLDQKAKQIVLISHLGRPNNKNDGETNLSLSLKPVANELSRLLEKPVSFVDQITGEKVKQTLVSARSNSIVMLENLRFSSKEEANDLSFAKQIVEDTQSEIFVQDGFAVIHRPHASTVQIPKLLPTVAGFLLEKEVRNLLEASQKPHRPVLILIGGSKITDKQPLIDHFLSFADQIVVGGKIATDGFSSGNPKIYVAEDFRTNIAGQKLDIGNLSLAKTLDFIDTHHTIIWNGVFGQTEVPPFDTSSRIIAEAIGRKDLKDNQTIICGGDTAGFVENLLLFRETLSEDLSGALNFAPDSAPLEYSLLSTGGGASLELLLDKPLPGLENILSREN